MAAVPETQVLQPKAATTHENEWPEFLLTGVDCYDSEGALASLLEADEKKPLTITGKLGQVEKGLAHLVIKDTKARISVTTVRRYAYGQNVDDDGEVSGVLFWAAGEAGWYKIEPSRGYKEIYRGMTKTIEKLYYLVDTYSKRLRTDVKDLFLQFAVEKHLEYAEDAASLFYNDRLFIIYAMLKDMREHALLAEDHDWSKTPFYEHMLERYPDDFTSIALRLGNRNLPFLPKKPVTGYLPQPTRSRGRPRKETYENNVKEEATKTFSRDMQSRGARRRATEKPVKRDDAWWRARAIFEFMQKAVLLKYVPNKEDRTLSAFSHAMVRSYEIEDAATAATFIKAYAEQLVPMMDAKLPREWPLRPVYRELKDAKVTAVDMKRMQQMKLQPRRKSLMPSDQEDTTEDSSSDTEDGDMHPSSSRSRHAKKGRLSIMRPAPSKSNSHSSGKGPARKSTSLFEDSDDSDPLEEMELDIAHDNSNSASGASRPSKRKRLSTTTASKNSYLSLPTPNIDASSTSDSDAASEIITDPSQDPTTALPLRTKPSSPRKPRSNRAQPATIAASLIPDLSAAEKIRAKAGNTSGVEKIQTWSCPYPSCPVKIYDTGATASAEQLIAEHRRTHLADAAEKHAGSKTAGNGLQRPDDEDDSEEEEIVPDDPLLALVQAEAREELPVDHLMRRIRAMVERQGKEMPVVDGGRVVGDGVRTRF